jgi:hypothetical protein
MSLLERENPLDLCKSGSSGLSGGSGHRTFSIQYDDFQAWESITAGLSGAAVLHSSTCHLPLARFQKYRPAAKPLYAHRANTRTTGNRMMRAMRRCPGV